MLSTVQADLHRAVENVIKELNRSYERCKKAEEEAEEARGKAFDLNASNECLTSINDNLKNTNSQLLKRTKELQARCEALQAELNKKVADLQKENRKLCEQLKSKSILDTVCFQKYWKQQLALESCERGETCEVELNNGGPFEKGYYLRISKEEYELAKSNGLLTRVAFMKHPDK